MPTLCLPAIKACRVRIIRVDACGKPVVGPKSVAAFKGFASVGRSPQYEEGEEFLQKSACGDLIINDKDKSRLKRIDMTISLVTIDPDVVEMTTANRLLLDGTGNAKGWATSEDIAEDGGFSLELWQKVSGGACDTEGLPLWHYWAWPFITDGTMGDMTFENGPFMFDVSGFTKKITAVDQWGDDNVGPFEVLPPTAALQPGDHEAKWVTAVQPPEDTCGSFPLALAV